MRRGLVIAAALLAASCGGGGGSTGAGALPGHANHHHAFAGHHDDEPAAGARMPPVRDRARDRGGGRGAGAIRSSTTRIAWRRQPTHPSPSGPPTTVPVPDHHEDILSTGSGPVSTLFQGDIITGIATVTYEVDPIPAGIYRFKCSVHPSLMVGQFVVE